MAVGFKASSNVVHFMGMWCTLMLTVVRSQVFFKIKTERGYIFFVGERKRERGSMGRENLGKKKKKVFEKNSLFGEKRKSE